MGMILDAKPKINMVMNPTVTACLYAPINACETGMPAVSKKVKINTAVSAKIYQKIPAQTNFS